MAFFYAVRKLSLFDGILKVGFDGILKGKIIFLDLSG